jgi:hypothetical protein
LTYTLFGNHGFSITNLLDLPTGFRGRTPVGGHCPHPPGSSPICDDDTEGRKIKATSKRLFEKWLEKLIFKWFLKTAKHQFNN